MVMVDDDRWFDGVYRSRLRFKGRDAKWWLIQRFGSLSLSGNWLSCWKLSGFGNSDSLFPCYHKCATKHKTRMAECHYPSLIVTLSYVQPTYYMSYSQYPFCVKYWIMYPLFTLKTLTTPHTPACESQRDVAVPSPPPNTPSNVTWSSTIVVGSMLTMNCGGQSLPRTYVWNPYVSHFVSQYPGYPLLSTSYLSFPYVSMDLNSDTAKITETNCQDRIFSRPTSDQVVGKRDPGTPLEVDTRGGPVCFTMVCFRMVNVLGLFQ